MTTPTSHWVRFTEPLTTADTGEPEPFIRQWLDRHTQRLGGDRGNVKVLDVGCGRGDRVAWLLEQGWDAYGADVEYVEQGDRWLEEQGHGAGRLRVIDNYRLPFADEAPFDLVLSYQVMEHIPHFDHFVAGITDIGRTGTRGLHVCPGAWMPVETHMQLPLVHWLPKGKARAAAIRAELAVGLGRPHFAELPTEERARRFAAFSSSEVFYRPPRVQVASFEWAGHKARFGSVVGEKLRTNGIPTPAARLLGPVYGRLRGCYIETEQLGQEPTGVRRAPSARKPLR